MIVKDMMPAFELYQPTQLADALALLDRHRADGWKLAGGNDSLSWFKERTKRPKAVIDISGIAELKGIRETPDGIEIGALTTLTEVERNPADPRELPRAGRCGAPGRQLRRSATPARWAATSRRMRAACTTATACPAIAPAATPASPTRRKG